MVRSRNYWLMKCEPEAYSIDDLARDGRTSWEGVRNFQARNMMRDEMKVGDGVLFYASNADPSGVAGIAAICREGYPDVFAFDPKHEYFDPKGDPANPTWMMVDVEFVEKFPSVVPLERLKTTPGLEAMMVIRKGMRLSVQPVTKAEFEIVTKLGRSAVAPAVPTKSSASKLVKSAPAKKPAAKKAVAKKSAPKSATGKTRAPKTAVGRKPTPRAQRG